MPSRGSAAARGAAQTPLDALPLPLALRIFALLPADARLLAAAVCRFWRAMLAERSLWTRLDLSEASGMASPSPALLCAAAARAGGQLEVLRVVCEGYMQPQPVLLAVLEANAGTLRELIVDDALFAVHTVRALLRAAPGLRRLEIGAHVSDRFEMQALRKEPPFGPLCLQRLHFINLDWPAVVEGLAGHPSLQVVSILQEWPADQAQSDAAVSALLSLPLLHSLSIRCAPAPVVARLLGCPALKLLEAIGLNAPLLLDSPAPAALLCSALRAYTQIETLSLRNMNLWHDIDAALALLAALQAHPSLRNVTLSSNRVPREHAAAAGAALGALIAKDSPALLSLDIFHCALCDVGLGPIMDALPRARHLRHLNCSLNKMSDDFKRERLLPAVRACGSLRELMSYEAPLQNADASAQLDVDALLQQRRAGWPVSQRT